jgi:hypothetical protein
MGRAVMNDSQDANQEHDETASMLTAAQRDLLRRYAALSAEQQALVDELIRHLADVIPDEAK